MFGGTPKQTQSDPMGRKGSGEKGRYGFGGWRGRERERGRGESWGLVMSLCGRSEGRLI